MSAITCPDCGEVREIAAFERGADEFCAVCDYPLFWSPSARPAGGSVGDEVTSRRRLPGAGGRVTIGSRTCPECAEQNLLSATHCIRCRADLDPKPTPPPVVEWTPPPPPPLPEPKRRWWPWILAAAVVIGLVVLVIVLS